jgi:hypothetical protein
MSALRPHKFHNLPDELKTYKSWVLWRYEESDGEKPTKVLYQLNGYHASVNDLTTWATFNQVVTAYEAESGWAGIGYVFSDMCPYGGVDLDKARSEENLAVQMRVYQEFNSYSERSPSGNGLHIIFRGSLPSGRRRGDIEIYTKLRFFTMTGDVWPADEPPKPIRDCQIFAEILYNQMAKNVEIYKFEGDGVQRHEDRVILEMALAAINGDKFKTLLTGDWRLLYASQSEADFAFINIVSFYTQNRAQIERIFLASPLGARSKAKRKDYVSRMIERSFDIQLPPLDMDGLYNNVQAQIAEAKAEPVAEFKPEPPADAITYPRGLVGDIARYIYAAAPRPVHELAIAGALGLMAGIVGRAYNVSGTGLNLYLLVLAATGTGKEAISSGIAKLVTQVAAIKTSGEMSAPSITKFIGASEISSGQAIYKALAKQPNYLSVIGEFGYKLQIMSSERANSNDMLLKRTLLDLYSKSGKGQQFFGMQYSDKEKDVAAITSPAFSILAESTPETFLKAVDERMIIDGLLPRFLTLEYFGDRPEPNPNHSNARPSPDLIDMLARLVVQCHNLNGQGTPIDVAFEPIAAAMEKSFNDYCDTKIRGNSEVLRQLWSRAHLKLLKVAALIAVGANPLNPVITKEDIEWSYRLIALDTDKLISRFEKGEVGDQDAAASDKQMKDVIKACLHYVNSDYQALASYKVDANAHKMQLIPHKYLMQKVYSTASFRADKRGKAQAFTNTIKALIDTGNILQVPPQQLENLGMQAGTKYYMLRDITF